MKLLEIVAWNPSRHGRSISKKYLNIFCLKKVNFILLVGQNEYFIKNAYNLTSQSGMNSRTSSPYNNINAQFIMFRSVIKIIVRLWVQVAQLIILSRARFVRSPSHTFLLIQAMICLPDNIWAYIVDESFPESIYQQSLYARRV